MNPRAYPVVKWGKTHKEFSGTLLGVLPGVARGRGNLYVVKEDHARNNGKSWRMFDTWALRNNLSFCPPGTHVKIKFLGKQKNKKDPKKEHYAFKISVRTPPLPKFSHEHGLAARTDRRAMRVAPPQHAVGART